jgi:hypothetical protein
MFADALTAQAHPEFTSLTTRSGASHLVLLPGRSRNFAAQYSVYISINRMLHR